MCKSVQQDSELVDLINHQNKERLSKIPAGRRALFLPHCMHNTEKCTAKQGDLGLECAECGNCDIAKIKRIAEGIGYRVFVVLGGSMVYKILRRGNIEGVIGVACHFELAEAAKILTAANMPGYGIPLIKNGCRQTLVKLSSLWEGLILGIEDSICLQYDKLLFGCTK